MTTFSFSDKSCRTQRVVGNKVGTPGPTVVFIGGIHGNEPSGVIALHRIFGELESSQAQLCGQVIGLAGNLPALAKNERFITQDLNRIWNNEFSKQFYARPNLENGQTTEFKEQVELFEIMEPLLHQPSPVFFIDLHTTSSPSVPFIAINDQLNNRKFALQFPVPTVLGIEEYLEGPLLSYLNDFGHVALAFEAGQHQDPESVNFHASFIYLALLATGVIGESDIPDLHQHQRRLAESGRANRGIFEVIFRKPILEEDEFSMVPGYSNFDTIQKGDLVAHDRQGSILAHRKGQIFMPLYQDSGIDGYFFVRKVSMWALSLSSVLRKINFERVLTWLPGITLSPDQPHVLIVKKKVARFLTTEIFHLLGYRRKKDNGHVMIFSRREIDANQETPTRSASE
jgi:predicted deacylase